MLSFRFGGYKVVLRFGFAMLLLIAFLLSGDAIIPCLVCCMLHECGHLLVCRMLHLPIRTLEFCCNGLTLHLEQNPQLLPYGKAMLLHGGGIFTNLLTAGLFWLCHHTFAPLAVWANVSLCLTVFHLIPAKSLDGGRMFLAFGERFLPAQWVRHWELLGDFIAFTVFGLLALAAFRSDQPMAAVAIAIAAACSILP